MELKDVFPAGRSRMITTLIDLTYKVLSYVEISYFGNLRVVEMEDRELQKLKISQWLM